MTATTNVLESRPYLLARTVLDSVALGLLWAAASLPLLTCAPATVALFGVVRDRRRGNDLPLARHFFRMFRENFRAAFAGGVIAFVLLGGAAANLVWSTAVPAPADFALRLAAVSVIVATLSSALYAAPLMVSYQMPLARVLRSSLLLAIGRPLTTMLGLGTLAAVAALTYLFPPAPILIAAPVAGIIYELVRRACAALKTSEEPGQ